MDRTSLDFEVQAGYPQTTVVGVDEVGRGCIAGPVVAAAVVLPEPIDFDVEPWIAQVQDSKLIRPTLREELAREISKWASRHAIASASVEEIDEINILQASHQAMARAVSKLGVSRGHVLIDGHLKSKYIDLPQTTIKKGDRRSLSIACASIVAKVHRDKMMSELDEDYPGYGLGKHKGYPTRFHVSALREKGVTPVHRRSFKPVLETLKLHRVCIGKANGCGIEGTFF